MFRNQGTSELFGTLLELLLTWIRAFENVASSNQLLLDNSTMKEAQVTPELIEVGLVVVAYIFGRVQQFVRDAKEVMGGKK
jgi:hypothetical protein